MSELIIHLKTLTPLWTGGVDQTCDRLHETGLIGSLRWWYEALVRGLGGYACDPTSENPEARCSFDSKAYEKAKATAQSDAEALCVGLRTACPVCYLFGCTGWARKFRLQVLDERGQTVQEAIQANSDIVLHFLELRPLCDEEKQLMAKAVEVATRYGALGGKTTLKPQSKSKVGDDYGIVQWIGSSLSARCEIQDHLQSPEWRKPDTKPPDLRWFFFFKDAFLGRVQMNHLLHLDEKGHNLPNPDELQRFLRGRRGSQDKGAASKKLFSFRVDKGRIWGYARDRQMRDEAIERIKAQLTQVEYTIKTGEEVLNEL